MVKVCFSDHNNVCTLWKQNTPPFYMFWRRLAWYQCFTIKSITEGFCCWTSDFRSKMGCKQHLCWLQTDYPVRKSILSANQSKGPTITGSAAYPMTFQSDMKPSTQQWAMFDINLCHSTSQDLTQSKSHKLSLRVRKFDKWVSIEVKSDNTTLQNGKIPLWFKSVRSRSERQTEKWFYARCESVIWRRQSIRL